MPNYRDVEDLLSPGFLSHTVRVARVKFAIRTLGPGDLFLLRHRTGDEMADWQIWAVASAIWMVNGHCILDKPDVTPRIFEMLSVLPRRAQSVLFSIFSGLVNRQQKAEDAIEPYMYENLSRSKWRAAGGNPIHITKGIPGAERLGQNVIQQIWSVFNEVEDRRIAQDQMWDGFKLVASSNSPKGVQKIDERDTRLRREEDARRQSVMDRYYYFRKGLVNQEGLTQNPERNVSGSYVAGPKTVDQLEQEMKRWVAGELDDHDRIVEDYKQRILDRQAEVEAEREERRLRFAAETEKRLEASFEVTPMVGYTLEQMQMILSSRGEGLRNTRFVHDEQYAEAKSKTDRHIHRPVSGNLAVQGDKLVSPTANPQADIRTLQEMIMSRNVEVGDEPQQRSEPEVPLSPLGPKPDHVSQSEWEEYGRRVNPSVFGGGRNR